MPATGTALIASQPGASVLAAWPQSPQTSTLNEDLIQIRSIGQELVVRVSYSGAVIGPKPAGALTLTSVAVSTFTVSNIAFAGSTNTITGVFTGGSSAWVGLKIALLGCTTPANNGTYTILTANTTTITVTNASGVSEAETATASVYSVSTATYNGTITGGGSSTYANQILAVTGFTNATNNITNTLITSSTISTLVVPFAGEINETHAGSAALTLGGTQFRTRVGRYQTTLAGGSTIAQYFANAFTNPSNLDILQVINVGGTASYYLNYLGVATGS
jgi:hypothetical protein